MPRDTHRWIQREMHREKKTCLETYTEIRQAEKQTQTEGERSTKSNIQHRDPQIEGDAETYIQRGTDIPRETEAETQRRRDTQAHAYICTDRQSCAQRDTERLTHTQT